MERVLHTSTSEVYGTASYVPINEAHPLQGQSPYSATKIGADKMAEAFFRSFDLPVVTVRPFNTFGPRQSAREVISHDHYPIDCRSARAAWESASDAADLNYVANTVDGFLAAAQAGTIAVGKTINLGSGREISIGDLAKLISRLMDRPLEIEGEAGGYALRAARWSAWSPIMLWRASCSAGSRRLVSKTVLNKRSPWIQEHIDLYQPGLYTL